MKIAYLSTFYPFRGGISQFNALLFRAFEKKNEVIPFTFKRQYPNFLFPGTSQYVTSEDNVDPIPSIAILDTVNPLTYFTAAKKVSKTQSDFIITRYWMTFFAPSLGFVMGKMRKKMVSIAVLDNVIPHEKRFFDDAFNKYFLSRNDGYVVMSDIVLKDLLSYKPDARYIKVNHPSYNQFGDIVERRESEIFLDLKNDKKNILFFGLIREYKGLDLLIDAFSNLDESYQLIIAGEAYEDFSKYEFLINNLPNKENVKVFNKYIPDNEVKYFFSVADVCILPYKTATQSGIAGISENFEVPMIATNVGGLKEYVSHGIDGLIVDKPEPLLIQQSIEKYFFKNLKQKFSEKIKERKKENSWEMLADKIVNFAQELKDLKEKV